MDNPTITLKEFKDVLDIIPYKIREFEIIHDTDFRPPRLRYVMYFGLPINVERVNGKWKLLNRVRI